MMTAGVRGDEEGVTLPDLSRKYSRDRKRNNGPSDTKLTGKLGEKCANGNTLAKKKRKTEK